jgi:DNA helicase-2/ATP-dependent DNA helicase PcrA
LDALFPEEVDWTIPFRDLAFSIDADDVDFDSAQLDHTLRTGLAMPEIPGEADFVRIMSLHKSKGLTADLVIIAGCLDGLVPRALERGSNAARAAYFEQQRRLFYVGITRTRNRARVTSKYPDS